MGVKLFEQQLLMLVITYFSNFQFLLVLFDSKHFSPLDLVRINKPDGAVIVFCELGPHLQDVDFVHFLDVVAHFIALLRAVTDVVVVTEQCNVIATSSVIVFYRFVALSRLQSWHRSVKLNYYRFAYTCL
jgi:hypothetical protein